MPDAITHVPLKRRIVLTAELPMCDTTFKSLANNAFDYECERPIEKNSDEQII